MTINLLTWEMLKHAPYPEIVDGTVSTKPYSIYHSEQPRVNIKNRQIFVTLTERGKGTTRHELGHIKWSPEDPPQRLRFSPLIMQAVEDARINTGLALKGFPVNDAMNSETLTDLLSEDFEANPGHAILRSVASIGTDLEDTAIEFFVGKDIRRRAWDTIEKIRKRLKMGRKRAKDVVCTFEHTIRISRELAKDLEDLLPHREDRSAWNDYKIREEEAEKKDRDDRAPDGSACAPDVGGGGEQIVNVSDDGSVNRYSKPEHKRLSRGRPEEDPEWGLWAPPGRMFISTPALPMAYTSPGRSNRHYSPSMEGSVMQYPHRWAVDQSIFRRRSFKGRGIQATIVIDISGSMKLKNDDIVNMMQASPWATTIATYSGRDREGLLTIVAKNGKRLLNKDIRRYGHGNIVDLPALLWLGKQRGLRLWISDGEVTGLFDRKSSGMNKACSAMEEKYNIHRMRDVAELLKFRDKLEKIREEEPWKLEEFIHG